MNKLPIIAVILSFTYSGYTQQEIKAVKLEEVTISPTLNHSYRNMVLAETSPDYVQNLQSEAATYDIRKDPDYKKDFEVYQVIFSQTNGSIIATYDATGHVLSTLERFKDVTPPQPVRNSIQKKYPDWTIHKDLYRVTYYHGKGATKVYQLQMRKNNSKKNLKIDSEGRIL